MVCKISLSVAVIMPQISLLVVKAISLPFILPSTTLYKVFLQVTASDSKLLSAQFSDT